MSYSGNEQLTAPQLSDVAYQNYWRGVREGALEERERIIKLLEKERGDSQGNENFDAEFWTKQHIALINGVSPRVLHQQYLEHLRLSKERTSE